MPSTDLVFFSHTSQPGGGELALLRYLNASGLPARLVTCGDGSVWADLRDREVLQLPGRSAPGIVAAVRREFRRRHARVIVANSMRAAFIAAITAPAPTRLVYWVRDGLELSAMSTRALWLTRNVTARRVEAYLANSEWTAETIAVAIPGAAVHVVPSASGVHRQEILERRPKPHPSSELPLRLLFLGRIAGWKAPDVAVRALAVLNERGTAARLTVAGDTLFGEDAYRRSLVRLVEELGLGNKVDLLGHVADVAALIDRHDVLLHCSTVPEPFGQVIVQALSRGLPVIATEQGGPARVLEHGASGVLYPPGDIRKLADAVEAVTDRATYERLSAGGLRRALDFCDEVAVTATDRVLERMLGS